MVASALSSQALELCALATQSHDFVDWWWKGRLGKCYYQLGLMRDAERQFASSLKNQVCCFASWRSLLMADGGLVGRCRWMGEVAQMNGGGCADGWGRLRRWMGEVAQSFCLPARS